MLAINPTKRVSVLDLRDGGALAFPAILLPLSDPCRSLCSALVCRPKMLQSSPTAQPPKDLVLTGRSTSVFPRSVDGGEPRPAPPPPPPAASEQPRQVTVERLSRHLKVNRTISNCHANLWRPRAPPRGSWSGSMMGQARCPPTTRTFARGR